MNRIVKATRGKPCSCPAGRECHACFGKKLKPRITVQQSRRGNIPIKVERFTVNQGKTAKVRDSLSSTSIWRNRRESRDKKLLEEKERERKAYQKQLEEYENAHKDRRDIKLLEERERKAYHKQLEEFEKANKDREFREKKFMEEKERERKAYQKQIEEIKKAQKEFDKQKEEERKLIEWEQRKIKLEKLEKAKNERLEKLNRKKEKEVLRQLKEQEKIVLKNYTNQSRVESGDICASSDDKKKQSKVRKKVKEKKPKKRTQNKTVYINKTHRYSWKDRFSHWFYRACCQFYCYLTCVLAVIFCIIYVI